jgi:nucleotide-binding universal stress UspA family protein
MEIASGSRRVIEMSIFPTRILVATDGPEQAELVVSTAAELAEKTGSELHIVHVLALRLGPLHDYPYSPDTDLQEEIEKKARTEFEELVERIRSSGRAVDAAHFRAGRPDVQIVEQAEEIRAGLIVVGSRGFGAIRRALIGDVSHSVVRHAHCPVMVVRGEPVVFPTKILLATDTSKEATLAANTALDLANSTDSELHVVHVAHLVPVFATQPEIEAQVDQVVSAARKLLDEQAEQIRAAGGSIAEVHLKVGRPDEGVVHLAEDLGTGLIVMGGRGLGGIRRALLGRVSDSVVRHAPCPVIVVRPEKERVTEH